ncbi:MAG: hypothetical protein WCS86_01370 [Candidatus Paceibacterota bacterium]
MNIKNKKKNNKDGFALLYAIMISSILLAIGLGVGNIAFKEIKFSTSAKDTNDAFFAADTGAECALYYDKLDQSKNAFTGSVMMDCVNRPIIPIESSPSVWTFTIMGLGSEEKGCTKVIVDKVNVTPSLTTKITSRGYNNAGANCIPTLNSVERLLEVNY